MSETRSYIGDFHGGRSRHVRRAAAIALVLAGALAMSFGCGRSAPERKILLLGIDGMDWTLADPLIEAGEMPNVAALLDGGVKVDLHSIGPVMKSPIIWTTIATGKGPDKHGIEGFVEKKGNAPLFNSLGWKARPIWDILGETGRTVGVINWLVNWPSLPVNGYNVSDRVTFSTEDGFDEIKEATYPPELYDELKAFQRPLATITDDEIAPLLNGDEWRTTDDLLLSHAVNELKIVYAVDEGIRDMTVHLLSSREQPDLLAVYMNGVDVSCHRFWGPMDPSSIDIRMSEEMVNTFCDVIPRYYRRMDEMIGSILENIDDDTTIILCSDHGFKGPTRTPDGIRLGIWMHGPIGVLAAKGPGIVDPAALQGGTIRDASIFDITPTLLALFGEPIGRDMDGFVLSDLIDPAFLEDHPVEYKDTYEKTDSVGAEAPTESSVDEDIKERLRSLGYIE